MTQSAIPRGETSNQASGISMSAKFCSTKPQATSVSSLVKYPVVVLRMPALRLFIESLARK